jgi:protein involved in ribonucleotide reduction
LIVYFSSASNYTHRFVEKLGLPAERIPLHGEPLRMIEEFVLLTPTYGAGGKGFVPKQVIKFLNDDINRLFLRGVIASGNTNFGEDFCKAGIIISQKCQVPLLYRFELMGLQEDVAKVKEGLNLFWEQPPLLTTN